jgi:hypothetical protein
MDVVNVQGKDGIFHILYIINVIVKDGSNMKFKKSYIQEIELNVSNSCLAECIMCSEPHGCDNEEIMQPKIFDIFIKQLKDISFDIIQTSGDGETFLNPHYLDYIRQLKKEFPNVPRWIYNNCSMLTKERADIIINEDLFNKFHTRIDSMHDWIFTKSSLLVRETVFKNLEYFLSINKKMPIVILYNNIKDYYNQVKNRLKTRPIRDRFTDEELDQVENEEKVIKDHFIKFLKNPSLLGMARINHGLWGERYRNDVQHDPKYPCPKINVIQKVCWIYPNGNIGICCYEDRQSPEWSLGNIQEKHILDIFYSEKRLAIIEKLKNLEHENPYSDYPCISPKLCGFGCGIESK